MRSHKAASISFPSSAERARSDANVPDPEQCGTGRPDQHVFVIIPSSSQYHLYMLAQMGVAQSVPLYDRWTRVGTIYCPVQATNAAQFLSL